MDVGDADDINNVETEKNKEEKVMKIMIPLDENKVDVCVSFGRAPFFLLHDTESGNSECLENPAAQSQGGAGIKAAQFVVDHHADALITVRCGENAAEVFKASGMKIYKADGKSAEEEIIELQEGRLGELTHFHAGFHGGH